MIDLQFLKSPKFPNVSGSSHQWSMARQTQHSRCSESDSSAVLLFDQAADRYEYPGVWNRGMPPTWQRKHDDQSVDLGRRCLHAIVCPVAQGYRWQTVFQSDLRHAASAAGYLFQLRLHCNSHAALNVGQKRCCLDKSEPRVLPWTRLNEYFSPPRFFLLLISAFIWVLILEPQDLIKVNQIRSILIKFQLFDQISTVLIQLWWNLIKLHVSRVWLSY